MSYTSTQQSNPDEFIPFYQQPGLELINIPVHGGIPLGIKSVANSQIGIAGAYGTWGFCAENSDLRELVEGLLGEPLPEKLVIDPGPLGFYSRHILPEMSPEEHQEVELTAGAQFLRAAARANNWEVGEVEALLVGISGPVVLDHLEQIAERAGIPDSALKVTVHKACDGGVGAFHLALNSRLGFNSGVNRNLADELYGRKILVGGIEGFYRFVGESRDPNAMQIFGNGAGIFGVIPGQDVRFLVGNTHEVYDEKGTLAAKMYYPHSRRKTNGNSNIEITQAAPNRVRVAGLMNEPANGAPIAMDGMIGMVKLFVRSGVQVVRQTYRDYQDYLKRKGLTGKGLRVTIAHHANLKINQLKQKTLREDGIDLDMPWLLPEFGNVSAASPIMAFLRFLPELLPGDHVMIDGFGAGTYYDVIVVEMGKRA